MPETKSTHKFPPKQTIYATIDDDDGWVEQAEDNGDLITWVEGETHDGVFCGRRIIDLPDDERNPGGGTATMLVFENPTRDTRWCTWETYQLRETFDKIPEGVLCRVTCKGERKAKQGNVKIFSVKTKGYEQRPLPF